VRLATSAALAAGVLATTLPAAQASGRVGSVRVGGIGSSGKGGHYVGPFNGFGPVSGPTCLRPGTALGTGSTELAQVRGTKTWYTAFDGASGSAGSTNSTVASPLRPPVAGGVVLSWYYGS
jgi:hypothetical protein